MQKQLLSQSSYTIYQKNHPAQRRGEDIEAYRQDIQLYGDTKKLRKNKRRETNDTDSHRILSKKIGKRLCLLPYLLNILS